MLIGMSNIVGPGPGNDPRTARHNGHADFLRERIDGRVGQ